MRITSINPLFHFIADPPYPELIGDSYSDSNATIELNYNLTEQCILKKNT